MGFLVVTRSQTVIYKVFALATFNKMFFLSKPCSNCEQIQTSYDILQQRNVVTVEERRYSLFLGTRLVSLELAIYSDIISYDMVTVTSSVPGGCENIICQYNKDNVKLKTRIRLTIPNYYKRRINSTKNQ